MLFYRGTSRGSALLISLIILILITAVTTVFLERIWWSSQTVEGIEASNAAYYQWAWIIEEQLMDTSVNKRTPWNIVPISEIYTYTGRTLTVFTGGDTMPMAWRWNSPYDRDYNIIALGQPVQIVIPNGINWSNVYFEFRVPSIDTTAGTGVANTLTSSGIILWTLGYSGASLYASWETQIFQWADINTSTNRFSSFSGITNSGSNVTLTTFYTTSQYLDTGGARCAWYVCTLKLSMIRPVETSLTTWGTPDGRILPFLEYRINFWWTNIPSQFMTLDATAYSYGFQRTQVINIPQITTNTALDFAVLQ